jgi:beta-glucosidase
VDNGNGVRNTDGVNGYPSGIHLGATWNKELVHETKEHLGAEFKRKGANVALGPVAGVLGRVARGGRNWEGFSNDPFLAGALLYESVVAMQKSVVTCVKHFVGNEQEFNRISPSLFTVGALNQSLSSNIDDKAMHEYDCHRTVPLTLANPCHRLYMWPFHDAIRAGAGAVMCSYTQLNGSHGCQNSKALNGLLKGEMGFKVRAPV